MSKGINLGQDGADVISDTAVHTPPDVGTSPRQVWFAVQVVETAVLNTSGTAGNWNNLAGLSGVSLSPGLTLYGRFTAIQLSSGKVIAYQRDV